MTPNIDAAGRWARGDFGLIFLLIAALLWSESRLLAGAFLVCALFSLFEAARGWCAVRACGIKTPF